MSGLLHLAGGKNHHMDVSDMHRPFCLCCILLRIIVVLQLRESMDTNEDILLIDVRPREQFDIAHLPGSCRLLTAVQHSCRTCQLVRLICCWKLCDSSLNLLSLVKVASQFLSIVCHICSLDGLPRLHLQVP